MHGVVFLVLCGCHPGIRQKVGVDLSGVDAAGLRRSSVAVAYEVCIPRQPDAVAAVKGIDPTVEVHPGSRGRVGCAGAEVLCIGHTNQSGYRRILRRLARLPFVREIRECYFE